MNDALRNDGLFPQTTFRKPNHPVGVRRNQAQIDFAFAAPVLATPTRALHGLVRGENPIESQAAAVLILNSLTAIQGAIMHILATEPTGHTAKELEGRIEFRAYAANTVRKRVSELAQAKRITQDGRRDGCAVWVIAV